MKEEKEILNFKVILLGDSTVGKTSMLIRYTDDIFVDNTVTTLGSIFQINLGIDFKKKVVETDFYVVKLQIWDTAGQERFRCSIPKDFYKNANGIILLYDVTSLESFNNVKNWIDNIEDNSKKNIAIVLVGNKCDKIDSRKVTLLEGQELSLKYDVLFFETSCKLNINIKETFDQLVERMIKTGKFDKKAFNLKNDIRKKDNDKCCK
jgi:small GTP-binding protein